MAVAHEHDQDDHVVERERVVDRGPTRTVAVTTAPNIVRMVLSIIGAGAMIVSAFLVWVMNTTNGSIVGTELTIRSYYRPNFFSAAQFLTSAGAVMILLGLLALLGMAGWGGWLTRIAGALGIIAFVLILIEMNRAGLSLPNDIGVGMWIALGGSLVALIGGFFSITPRPVDDV
jgi:hypothetical protein